MSSTQVIDVKVKKPRAPKKDKNEPSDSIPPPTTTAVTETSNSNSVTATETKTTPLSDTKKPRATKKDKTSTETPVETASTSPTATAESDVESDAKQKKPRAPTLPAKFAKFIKFNFFFINQLTDIDQETKDAYLNTFAVFAPVEQQTQIVTDFLLTQKSVNKDYRSAISAQKKAAAKANKPQRRSKKSVQVDFQNNLVNQLIESANQTSDTNETNDTNDKKEKKPRGRKPKQTESVTNTTSSAEAESTPKDTKDAKEKKPRGRKPKQTDAVTTTEAAKPSTDASANPSTEDDDEDTEVSRFVHGGKTFLRDQNNNLYDELSHEPVGEYDPATDSVINL